MQTGNEEDEESFSQTGVQEGRRREGGEVCGDGEITRREAGSQEMFLPSQDHLPSCGGSGLQEGPEDNVQLHRHQPGLSLTSEASHYQAKFFLLISILYPDLRAPQTLKINISLSECLQLKTMRTLM